MSTPGLRVNGIDMASEAVCPIPIGHTGIWFNGTSHLWRNSDGTDSAIGGGVSAQHVTALRALSSPGTDGTPVVLSGYHAEGDGGGGEFYWDAASTDADDGGLTFKLAAVTTGRLKRRISKGHIDPRWFGAVGDDTSHPLSGYFATLADAQAVYPHAVALTDEIDWVAFQAAVNAVAATITGPTRNALGGSVVPSKGVYLFNRALKANASLGVTIRGYGRGSIGTGNANNGSVVLVYTNADNGRFIDGRSAGYMTLDSLSIMYSSPSYSGNLVDFSHYNTSDATGCVVRNCALGGGLAVTAGTGARCLVNLSNAIYCTIEKCSFGVAVQGVRFREPDGSYSNSNTVRDCLFVYNKYATTNAGERCTLDHNTFEGGAGVMQAAYFDDYTDVIAAPARTFTFDGTAKTIVCSSGSFVTDGWVVGQAVSCFEQVGGLNVVQFNANISAVNATTITLAGCTNIVNETRTSDCKLYGTSVVIGSPSPTSYATLGDTLTFSGSTITRSTGSWITDGVYLGQALTISGTASNNGPMPTPTSLSATVLDFGAVSMTFAGAGNTITRTGVGSFLTDGWAIGMPVTVAGTSSNNGSYGNVSNVTATVLTVTGASFVSETISTADVYSLLETAFQARSKASTGHTFTGETATAGHVYQVFGNGGVLTFRDNWMGDQFVPTTWIQCGAGGAVNLSANKIVGGLRVASFRQTVSGFNVNDENIVVVQQEPFEFQDSASGINIAGNDFSGTNAADIYVVRNSASFGPAEMGGNTPTGVGLKAETVARLLKAYSLTCSTPIVFTKDGNATSYFDLGFQINQGTGSIGVAIGCDATNAHVQSHSGQLYLQWFTGHVVMVGQGNGFVDVGHHYRDFYGDGNPKSLLDLHGAIATPYYSPAADWSPDFSDSYVDVDATAAPRTVTLPDATTCRGREYTIGKVDASANTVTTVGTSAQTIDGAANKVLSTRWDSFTVKSDGSNWRTKK